MGISVFPISVEFQYFGRKYTSLLNYDDVIMLHC